jgi:redox-sensing transcriptional repressor
LAQQVQSILKVDKVWDVVVIGAGDIGSALARYPGLNNRGFRVVMLFDSSPEKIGMDIGGFIVQDAAGMLEQIQASGVQIAMMAVPAGAAQEVADQLVQAGVKAILNYAPISINIPPDVRVQYIDPVTHLQRMTYYLV